MDLTFLLLRLRLWNTKAKGQDPKLDSMKAFMINLFLFNAHEVWK